MTVHELMERKIDNLLKAIRRDLISKDEAFSQFIGYTKAFAELGLLTAEATTTYRNELAKVIY